MRQLFNMGNLNKSLTLLLIFLIFICISNEAYTQCQNEVKLTNVKKVTNGQQGSIEVQINTPGSFTLQLKAYKSTEKELLREIVNTGSQTFKFEDLSDEFVYRVIVKFDSGDFLCSNKVLDNILLKEE